MHVGGVEVVLLVPGGRRQDDVGVDAGRGHAEVERDQQVELSLRRLLVPHGLGRLGLALLPEILAHDAMRRAEQVLQEVFVSLARGAEKVGAPHEHVARPVLRAVGILAGQLELAALELLHDVVLGLHAGGGGIARHLQRVGLELRRRRQPAHALGPDVVVDDRAVPCARRRGRRDDVADVDRLVAPLVGVGIERRRRVLLPRRAAPVEGEGERRPAGLRPELLLADIVRPAAARLADAAAHRQHVDHAAIVHVGVVPVVHRRADDDHRAAVGLLGVGRELARHLDDLVARDAGDLLGPGRRVGHVVVERLGDIGSAQPGIDAVVGDEQVVDRGDEGLAVDQLQRLHRHAPLRARRRDRSRRNARA